MEKNNWIAKFFRWKVSILVTLLLSIAFILTLFRLSVIVLAHHSEFIEKWVSVALGQPVQIKSIQADWTALDPKITFKNVLLKRSDSQLSFVQVNRLAISIDVIRSILHWKLLPGRLNIRGINLDIDRLSAANYVSSTNHSAAFEDLIHWILSQGNIEISDVNIRYHFNANESYVLRDLHVTVKNNLFDHRIWGGAKMNENSPAEVQFVAALGAVDPSDMKFNLNGYIQLKNIPLDQWAKSSWMEPYLKQTDVKKGEGDFELWFDWKKTKITAIQGRWHIKGLESLPLTTHKPIDIDNMSGDFIWNPENNIINLQMNDTLFSLPNAYRSPFLVKKLTAQLQWNRDEVGLHFYVPYYQFSILGLKSQGEFYLTLPTAGKPSIDLLSTYQFPELSQLSAFFPALNQTFLKGNLPQATVAYRGPIEADPFKQREGHLSAEFQVRNASLSYYPGWPVLSSLNSNIEVSDRAVDAVFVNPRIGDNRVDQLKANMDDFMMPRLNIEGILRSNVGAVYKFLQDSPVALKIDTSNILSMQTPVLLNLQINIDFNKLSFPIQSQGEADILGSSLRFQINTMDSVVRLGVNGNINVDSLNQGLSKKLLKGVSGNADYQAAINIYRLNKQDKRFDATFSTDMKGIVLSGFPAFINKSADKKNPLRLHVVASHQKPMIITLRYRDDVLMRLLANNQGKQFKLLSGAMYVGKALTSAYPTVPGFVIYGAMADFNWEKWEPYIMPFIREENGAIDIPEIFGLPLRYVELHFDHVEAYHQLIRDMYFKLIPRLSDWMFEMKSPQVAGTFFIPNYSGGTWAGHFDHLNISKVENKGKKQKRKPLNIDPRSIPPIDVEIKKLYYGEIDYGHWELRTRPNAQGLSINTLSIDAPTLRLNMKGEWEQYHQHQITSVSGNFQTTDLGQVLLNAGIKDSLRRGHGVSTFQLSWDDAPDQMKPEKLNGSIDFDFHHGQILKIDQRQSKELNMGKLINAFNIEELPRRLSLDFHDITGKGLEFRLLKGRLDITEGVCKMKDSVLDSSVAKLKINGTINFPRKYYDLDVSVAPYVTSSIPLIVGIAGGPIAGAIAWVVNKIAAPEIGKAMGFVYHTQGSWDKSKDQKLPRPAFTIH